MNDRVRALPFILFPPFPIHNARSLRSRPASTHNSTHRTPCAASPPRSQRPSFSRCTWFVLFLHFFSILLVLIGSSPLQAYLDARTDVCARHLLQTQARPSRCCVSAQVLVVLSPAVSPSPALPRQRPPLPQLQPSRVCLQTPALLPHAQRTVHCVSSSLSQTLTHSGTPPKCPRSCVPLHRSPRPMLRSLHHAASLRLHLTRSAPSHASVLPHHQQPHCAPSLRARRAGLATVRSLCAHSLHSLCLQTGTRPSQQLRHPCCTSCRRPVPTQAHGDSRPRSRGLLLHRCARGRSCCSRSCSAVAQTPAASMRQWRRPPSCRFCLSTLTSCSRAAEIRVSVLSVPRCSASALQSGFPHQNPAGRATAASTVLRSCSSRVRR